MLMLGTGPVGGPIVGWIAERASAPASLAVGGAISAVTALYVGARAVTIS
jgi:hypothetical protein